MEHEKEKDSKLHNERRWSSVTTSSSRLESKISHFSFCIMKPSWWCSFIPFNAFTPFSRAPSVAIVQVALNKDEKWKEIHSKSDGKLFRSTWSEYQPFPPFLESLLRMKCVASSFSVSTASNNLSLNMEHISACWSLEDWVAKSFIRKVFTVFILHPPTTLNSTKLRNARSVLSCFRDCCHCCWVEFRSQFDNWKWNE